MTKHERQLELYTLLEQDREKIVKFWRVISHTGRTEVVKQLDLTQLKNLFRSMAMEDESILLGMLSDETKNMLLGTLTVEQQNELFFYQHFNLKEKTDMDTKKFVTNLADDYYEQNN